MTSSTLFRILSDNTETEIGKRWDFASIHSLEAFRRNVPLTCYDDYQPYIERMVEKGEKNLIARGEVVFYAPTSGTTSKSKLLPRFSSPTLKFSTKKNLLLLCWHKDTTTSLGVPIKSASCAVIGATIDADPSAYAAPIEAYKIDDMTTALYVQLVFGLLDPSVENIWSPFCPTVLTAIKLLIEEWKQMVDNIRTGVLKQSLRITDAQKKVLEESMGGPNSQRADDLEAIFNQSNSENFEALAFRLWPKLVTVDALGSGPLSFYVPKVKYYLGKEVCLFSSVYAASEGPGLFGINKEPFSHPSAYSLLTDKIFFEFIPIAEVESENPKVYLAEEVKEGEVYEIVLTTNEGLYRYRIGDIVKIIEVFSNGSQSPLIDLLGRTKTLSLHSEKLSDFHVSKALDALGNGPWKQYTVKDFIVTADLKPIPPRHQFWLEITPAYPCVDITASERTAGEAFLDTQLAKINGSYASGREKNMISSPKITLLTSGTFAKIIEVLKQRSPVTEAQLKMPRTTTDPELIAVLETNLKP